MGTLSVQPPSGAVRSLTEVFILLRNNAVQSRHIFAQNPADDRMSLIPLTDGDAQVESGGDSTLHNRIPPEWISVVDELQYEMTRLHSSKVRTRLKELKELQQTHLTRPSFNDDSSQAEEARIETVTLEITRTLNHCQSLLQHIQSYEHQTTTRGERHLLKNGVQSLVACLQNLANEYRSSQGAYLRQVRTRDDSFQQYFDTNHSNITFGQPQTSSTLGQLLEQDTYNGQQQTQGDNTQGQLSLMQLQAMDDNTQMVHDREREILHVTSSITELNTLFKGCLALDLASFVLEQGTILDRIDFNIEQTDIQVKSGLTSLRKAEKHQRKNRKMKCIVILSAAIIFWLIMFLVFRT